MDTLVLMRGANAPLDPSVRRLRIVMGWADDTVDVDASALLLAHDGKVRDDEDFVFYNQPVSKDGAVQPIRMWVPPAPKLPPLLDEDAAPEATDT